MEYAKHLPKAYKLVDHFRRRLVYHPTWVGYNWRFFGYTNYAYILPPGGIPGLLSVEDAKVTSWVSMIMCLGNFLGLLLVDLEMGIVASLLGVAFTEGMTWGLEQLQVWAYTEMKKKADEDARILDQLMPGYMEAKLGGYQIVAGSSGLFSFLAGALLYLQPKNKWGFGTMGFPTMASFSVMFSNVALLILEIAGLIPAGVAHPVHFVGNMAGGVAGYLVYHYWGPSRPLMVWNPLLSWVLGILFAVGTVLYPKPLTDFLKKTV